MVDWKLKVSETDPLEVEGHSEISVEIRVRESGFWYMEASQRIQDREERAVLLEAQTQYNWEFEPGAKNVLKWWRDLPKKKNYSILLSSDFCGLIFAFFSVITDFWSAAGEVGPVAFHGKQIISSRSLIFCFLKSRAIFRVHSHYGKVPVVAPFSLEASTHIRYRNVRNVTLVCTTPKLPGRWEAKQTETRLPKVAWRVFYGILFAYTGLHFHRFDNVWLSTSGIVFLVPSGSATKSIIFADYASCLYFGSLEISVVALQESEHSRPVVMECFILGVHCSALMFPFLLETASVHTNG